jgi:hypothetical protein
VTLSSKPLPRTEPQVSFQAEWRNPSGGFIDGVEKPGGLRRSASFS